MLEAAELVGEGGDVAVHPGEGGGVEALQEEVDSAGVAAEVDGREGWGGSGRERVLRRVPRRRRGDSGVLCADVVPEVRCLHVEGCVGDGWGKGVGGAAVGAGLAVGPADQIGRLGFAVAPEA